MRVFWLYLLMITLTLTAVGQTSVKTNCAKFPINEHDSICLDAEVNIAPEEVERIIRNEQKNVLLIFDGWVNWNKRLINMSNLQNESIVDYLKKYRIITLYVDDRVVLNVKDSLTVGKRNMMYQMDRFQVVTQPYYIIIKGGKAKCSSGYMADHKAVLSFFKRCE